MGDEQLLDTLIVGSITSDIALKDFDRLQIQEIMEFILGHPIWTHELGMYIDKVNDLIIKQQPSFLKLDSETTDEMAYRLMKKYGSKTLFKKGHERRVAHPMDTLLEVAGDTPVIVVAGDKDDKTNSSI